MAMASPGSGGRRPATEGSSRIRQQSWTTLGTRPPSVQDPLDPTCGGQQTGTVPAPLSCECDRGPPPVWGVVLQGGLRLPQRGGDLGEVSKQQDSGNKSPSQKTSPRHGQQWGWVGTVEGGVGGMRARPRPGEAWVCVGGALSSGSWTPVGGPGELSVSPRREGTHQEATESQAGVTERARGGGWEQGGGGPGLRSGTDSAAG